MVSLVVVDLVALVYLVVLHSVVLVLWGAHLAVVLYSLVHLAVVLFQLVILF